MYLSLFRTTSAVEEQPRPIVRSDADLIEDVSEGSCLDLRASADVIGVLHVVRHVVDVDGAVLEPGEADVGRRPCHRSPNTPRDDHREATQSDPSASHRCQCARSSLMPAHIDDFRAFGPSTRHGRASATLLPAPPATPDPLCDERDESDSADQQHRGDRRCDLGVLDDEEGDAGHGGVFGEADDDVRRRLGRCVPARSRIAALTVWLASAVTRGSPRPRTPPRACRGPHRRHTRRRSCWR